MPDYYFELRRQQAAALEAALAVLDEVASDFARLSGRLHEPHEAYRLEDAERAIVALGSTAGTVKDVVDELRDEDEAVGLLKLVSFRPFPVAGVAAALDDCTRVAVLDRADSPGGTPHSTRNLRPRSTAVSPASRPRTASAAATCTRRTCVRSSTGRQIPTSDCEASDVPSEDDRAEPARRSRCEAGIRSARAAGFRWSSARS